MFSSPVLVPFKSLLVFPLVLSCPDYLQPFPPKGWCWSSWKSVVKNKLKRPLRISKARQYPFCPARLGVAVTSTADAVWPSYADPVIRLPQLPGPTSPLQACTLSLGSLLAYISRIFFFQLSHGISVCFFISSLMIFYHQCINLHSSF